MREHSKGGTAFKVKMFIGVMCVMLVLIIVGAFSIMYKIGRASCRKKV